MAERPLALHSLFRQIALDFGKEVLTENRLKGFLSDYGGMQVNKYQHVITRSISYQMGRKLLAIRELDDADYALKLSNLRQAFQEENFFRHNIANYMVDCYLFALEWIDTVREYNEDEGDSSGTRKGELSFVNHSGSDYCGNYNEEKERSGFGISKDDNSNYYAGEWKLNMKNGVGINVNAGQSRYAGEWRMNRKAGVGIEITTDGMRYAGEWKNGKMHGIGTLFFPNGERLCTRFSNGEIMSGNGIYFLQDGSCIVGQMSLNGPHGKCLHYHRDGSCDTEMWNFGTKKQ